MHASTPPQELFEAWRNDLGEWGIPDEILSMAPEKPWGFPSRIFAERAERQVLHRSGRSYLRAEEALPPGGTVIDVGAGAGAASLPLGAKASLIVAVDSDPGMLSALTDLAGRIPEAGGVRIQAVPGTWPEAGADVPVGDVVVCHHVLYNVPDLRPFVEELTLHARERVVVEMTEAHPTAPMTPLWLKFHGLVRPQGPTAEDAVAAISSLGIDLGVERWDSAPVHTYESFDEMVAFHRRRLCLPVDADPQVAAALEELGVDPDRPQALGTGRPMVTLWWDGAGA